MVRFHPNYAQIITLVSDIDIANVNHSFHKPSGPPSIRQSVNPTNTQAAPISSFSGPLDTSNAPPQQRNAGVVRGVARDSADNNPVVSALQQVTREVETKSMNFDGEVIKQIPQEIGKGSCVHVQDV